MFVIWIVIFNIKQIVNSQTAVKLRAYDII